MTVETLDRTKFIGSSEIAAVMGLSRWTTPLKLWAMKTGRMKLEEVPEAMEWGTRLEAVVAEKFAEKNDMKLMAYKKRFVHPEYPFISCELDRIRVGTDEIVEVKTCSAYSVKEWEAEEVPIEYVLQVNLALGLSGRTIGYFAVLIGGQKYIQKKITFDKDLYEKQVEAAVRFWNTFVIPDVPPQAVGDDQETLVALYPESVPNIVYFEGADLNEVNALMNDRGKALGALKLAEDELDEIEARLKQKMGENEAAETDTYKLSWKTQKRSSVDTARLKEDGLYEKYAKSSTCRVFKTTKKGEAK